MDAHRRIRPISLQTPFFPPTNTLVRNLPSLRIHSSENPLNMVHSYTIRIACWLLALETSHNRAKEGIKGAARTDHLISCFTGTDLDW